MRHMDNEVRALVDYSIRLEKFNDELSDALQTCRAENAKLRDDLDQMTEAVVALHSAPLEDQLLQALNENAKLRDFLGMLCSSLLENEDDACDADACPPIAYLSRHEPVHAR